MSTRNLGYVVVAVAILFLLSDYVQQGLALICSLGAK